MGVQLLQRVADLSKSLCWDAKHLQKRKGKLDHTVEEKSFKGPSFRGNTLSLGAVGVSWGIVSPMSPKHPTEMLWGLSPLSPGTTRPPKKLQEAMEGHHCLRSLPSPCR